MMTIKRLETATGVSWLVRWRDANRRWSEKRFPTKREAEAFAAALPKAADAKGGR